MLRLEKRKTIIVMILSLLLNLMLIIGWQLSMEYGSSIYQSEVLKSIGVLPLGICFLIGIIQWPALFALFYFLFLHMEQKSFIDKPTKAFIPPRYVGLVSFVALYTIWLFFLWACYPGYYNYDVGHQLPQFLYEQVQYGAHHPLLHTLLEGSIIALGYKIHGTDLTLGVFLYNAFQMLICSACLSYSLHFIYKQTKHRILTICSFIFYAICPPIVMFAMSTTKDVICYCFLLVAFLQLWELYHKMENDAPTTLRQWLIIGICLTISCLFRRNIIYAVVLFAIFSILFIRKERKKQILMFLLVFLSYKAIDTGLIHVLDATPTSINEALCVPYQQIARLYNEVGVSAFTEEEYEFLSQIVQPEALTVYDPVMGDYTKAIFNSGLDYLKANAPDFFFLWVKKGIQYPDIYIESFLYNTYQAWYPATQIIESRGPRYFDITDWQYTYGTPHLQKLFDFYEDVRFCGYVKYPVLRLICTTGVMFFATVITWFYGIWRKEKSTILSFLLILLVCATTFCGPVSDIRYYLILFYLFPIGFGVLMKKNQSFN